MPTLQRIGVILAAGRGRRLGGTKQLTAWGTGNHTTPLVCAAYDAIASICDAMIVVLGHEADAVAAALEDRKFHSVVAQSDAPMFESIRAGIDAARRLNPSATVVLQPGDHPRVAAATLKLLAESSLKRPVHSIIPQYRDLGGHPVLIPPKVAATLLNNDCPAGLGQFWLDNPGLCHRVAVDDPDVLRDIDTPADLAS